MHIIPVLSRPKIGLEKKSISCFGEIIKEVLSMNESMHQHLFARYIVGPNHIPRDKNDK